MARNLSNALVRRCGKVGEKIMADLNTLHTVARVVLALMALIAAILWFISARIEVPHNIDTIVRRLQRIGFWNGWASVFSCIAALFGALDVFLTMIETIK
jgi:hypothetical protein